MLAGYFSLCVYIVYVLLYTCLHALHTLGGTGMWSCSLWGTELGLRGAKSFANTCVDVLVGYLSLCVFISLVW